MKSITKDQIIKWVKTYTLPLLFIAGIVLLLFYYFFRFFYNNYFQAHITGFKEIFGIGLTILGSGIFLAVLKWFQFMGFFREELQEIIQSSDFEKKLDESINKVIYSDAFLNSRNDLDNLWRRVNRALFKNQFPDELAEKIEQKMQDVFFHNSKLSHYYKNFIETINASFDNENYLTLNITIETKVVRLSTDKFDYDFFYFVEKSFPDDNKAAVNFNRVSISETDVDLNKVEVKEEGLRIAKRLHLELEGRKEYSLFLDVTLIYKMDEKDEFKFFAERFIDYLRIEVRHSPNLRIIFVPFGNEVFSEIKLPGQGFIRSYPEVLLPEKGFRLIFIKR